MCQMFNMMLCIYQEIQIWFENESCAAAVFVPVLTEKESGKATRTFRCILSLERKHFYSLS